MQRQVRRLTGRVVYTALAMTTWIACASESRVTSVPVRPRVIERSPPDHSFTIDEVMDRVGADSDHLYYRQSTSNELAGFYNVAYALFGRPTIDPFRLNDAAYEVGFASERWHVDGEHYLVLTELPDERRGAGIYLVRETDSSASRPTVLFQVPHGYFDLGVRTIAARAFFAAPARSRIDALFVNTIHRYQKSPGKRRRDKHNPTDVAHNPHHPFSEATRAAADNTSDLFIFQLHGFGNRFTGEDRPDAIISTTSSNLTRDIADGLTRTFPEHNIRRFPDEIDQLGGLTNVQRRLVGERSDVTFIHVEMSRRFRLHLIYHIGSLDRFLAVLSAAIRQGHGGGNEHQ